MGHLQGSSDQRDFKAANFIVEIKCFVQGRQMEAFQTVYRGVQRNNQSVDRRNSRAQRNGGGPHLPVRRDFILSDVIQRFAHNFPQRSREMQAKCSFQST